jgi:hypothetical protein
MMMTDVSINALPPLNYVLNYLHQDLQMECAKVGIIRTAGKVVFFVELRQEVALRTHLNH